MDKVIRIPGNYSKTDKDTRQRCLEELDRLKKEFDARAAPYIKILADIEARTPSAFMFVEENGG